MVTATVMPEPRQRYYNNLGLPNAGGKLYTYAANSSTPKATYTDAAGTIPHPNPIILDAKGEALVYWAGAYQVDLKTSLGVQVTGYPVVNFNTDPAGLWTLAATLLTSAGASMIGYIQSATGAVYRTVKSKLSDELSMFDFMTAAEITDCQSGSPTIDITAKMQAARDWLKGANKKKHLVFHDGTYLYSVSPNWAIDKARIIAKGEVRLRYTGTGNAVILDAGPTVSTDVCYDVVFGGESNFIIEAPTTAKNGCYVRSVHHSVIRVKCHGAGVNDAGLRVEFAVCTHFPDYICSANDENGWYGGAKPAYGMYLTCRGANESISYCMFVNPIIEAVPTGCYMGVTLGNIFLGGTMEGCTQYGMDLSSTASDDKIIGTDFEINTLADIRDAGKNNQFECDTYSKFQVATGAVKSTLKGGAHAAIQIDAGAQYTLLSNFKYDRFLSGATIADAGTGTRYRDLFNVSTSSFHNVPRAFSAIVVSASPFTYVNNTQNPINIAVSGGVVSSIIISRSAGVVLNSVISGLFELSPADAIIVTWTTIPNMYLYTK